MPTIRKFLFDTSFDDDPAPEPEAPAVAEPPPPPPPTFGEAELAAARAEGYASGFDAGEAGALARAEAGQAAALDTVAALLGKAAEDIAAIGPAAERRAVEIGLAVARKLLPELVRREAMAEIEALVRECLRDLFDEPRVVVRVPDALLDPLNERIAGIAARSGFAGRVILLAEESLGAGDCRIEWADGGVERSAARLWREIDAAVARTLAAPAATHPTSPTPTPAG